MFKGDLLKGQAVGTSLFVALTIGAIIEVCVHHTLHQFGSYDSNGIRKYWIGLAVWMFLLSAWQAILICPTFMRKLAWVLASLIVSVRTIDPALAFRDWCFGLALSAFVQGIVLLGVRKRVWIWLLCCGAALGGAYFEESVYRVYWAMYQKITTFVPKAYVTSFLNSYYLLHNMMFGAVVSYFMPPVNKQQCSRR